MKQILVVILLCSSLTAQQKAPAHDLADAERAFSAASEKIGITASFVEFLDDSCVMFNPGPVNGKELYRKRKENGAHLIWSPSFVETAASGDFGISTGPWEYRRKKGDTSVSYGHYFSVWQKDRNGVWKVILDNGIDYPSSLKKNEKGIFRSMSVRNPSDAAVTSGTIRDLEHSFSEAAAQGLRAAYQKYSAEDIMMFRKGAFPISSKKEAISITAKDAKGGTSVPVGAAVSSSGDLGFTYGLVIGQMNDTSSYVRVWRKEKQWKIAADLQEAFPK